METYHERLARFGIRPREMKKPEERQVYFTGWKDTTEGMKINVHPNDFHLIHNEHPGSVGQLIYWFETVPGVHRGLYVNLPGLQSGNVAQGETFYIGTERVGMKEITPAYEDLAFTAGMKIMQSLIDHYTAPVAESDTAQPSEG